MKKYIELTEEEKLSVIPPVMWTGGIHLVLETNLYLGHFWKLLISKILQYCCVNNDYLDTTFNLEVVVDSFKQCITFPWNNLDPRKMLQRLICAELVQDNQLDIRFFGKFNFSKEEVKKIQNILQPTPNYSHWEFWELEDRTKTIDYFAIFSKKNLISVD